MAEREFDVVVIGAGQAGLGVSCCLKRHGIRHIVLERARIGETWRTQRWDSFVLNSPNKFNVLPGDSYKGANPDGFDSAINFVSYLEGYAARFQLPVQPDARVVSVERNSAGFLVTAMVNGSPRRYACRQVVVASGGMNEPRIPACARNLSPDARQIHAGDYRSPSLLPEGNVLVVGSAQTGLQVAEEILDAGRRVYLSTSAVGRVPRRYRGKDILEWLVRIGFYDVKTEDVTDPGVLDLKPPQVSGVGPLGHTHSLQSLAGRGALILGRFDSANGTVVSLQPNAAEHVRFSDEVSGRMKALIEEFIARNSLDAPPREQDRADEPDTGAACASPMRTLDLRKENIRSIVWATGFSADYRYLKVDVIDDSGKPVHRNGIANVPGVYFVGLPWLRKRKSGIIHGIEEDASYIAENINQSLQGRAG